MTTPASRPQSHYYAPPTQGGWFENHLDNVSGLIGELLVVSAGYLLTENPDAFRLSNTAAGGAGQVASQIATSVLGEVGRLIDNLPRMLQNFETSLDEMNDPNSWMMPDIAD